MGGRAPDGLDRLVLLAVILQSIMQGYGSDFQGSLPGDHPPILTNSAIGSGSVPGVKTRVLSVYHNGIIWTADPRVRS